MGLAVGMTNPTAAVIKPHGLIRPAAVPGLEGAVRKKALLTEVSRHLTDKPVALLVAPAGYGKTAFLTHYMQSVAGQDTTRCIYVSFTRPASGAGEFVTAVFKAIADAGCQVPHEDAGGHGDFLSGDFVSVEPAVRIVEALRKMKPPVGSGGDGDGAARGAEDGVAEDGGAEGRETARPENDDGRDDGRIDMIIDEFHFVQNPDVEDLLQGVIARLEPNMRILVAARRMPEIGARKMEMWGRAVIFGPEDFAFTSDEVGEVVNANRPDAEKVPGLDVETLAQLSMGWPVCVNAARRWLDDNASLGEPSSYFEAALASSFDYIAEEVYRDIPEKLREWMEQLSVLPSFDIEAAKAVTDGNISTGEMFQLRALHPFVIEVDPRRQLLRFHPVIKMFLDSRRTQRNSTEDLSSLYRRIALHYRLQGENYRAVSYALRTHDKDFSQEMAAHVGVSLRRLIIDLDLFNEVMANLKRYFDGEIPQLRPAQALFAMRRGEFNRARHYLDKTKADLEERSAYDKSTSASSLEVDFLAVSAYYDIYRGAEAQAYDDHLARLRSARLQTYSADPVYLGMINNALSVLLMRKGAFGEAKERMVLACREFDKAKAYFSVILTSCHKGMVNLFEGDVAAARSSFHGSKNSLLVTDQQYEQLSAFVDLGLAACGLESGEVQNCYRRMSRALDVIIDSEDYWAELFSFAYVMKARAAMATEGFDAAHRTLLQGAGRAKDRDLRGAEKALYGALIHLAAVAERHDVLDALRADYRGGFDDIFPSGGVEYGWLEDGHLAVGLVRAEISRGDLDAALRQIDRLRPIFEDGGLGWFANKMTVLEALAMHKKTDTDDSDEADKAAGAAMRALVNKVAEGRIGAAALVEEGALAREALRAVAYRFRRIHTDAEGFKSNIVAVFEDWFRYNERLHGLRNRCPKLTIKQTEVLLMVAENLSYSEMCARARAVESAISQTIAQLRRKYRVEMREELAALVRYQAAAGVGVVAPDAVSTRAAAARARKGEPLAAAALP